MAKILPFKATGMRPLLRDACARHQLVRLWRGGLEAGSFCGYVGGVGHEFFMLWVLGDNLAYDGVYVMRQRDITDIEVPDKHHVFLEQAMAIEGLEPRMPGGFALDDVAGVIASATRQADVISVRVDNDDPEESEICYIGRLVGREEDGFSLQEVSPEAIWLREPSFFGWDEISTVCFDDPYARVLTRVAGVAPALESGDSGVGHVY